MSRILLLELDPSSLDFIMFIAAKSPAPISDPIHKINLNFIS